MERRTGRKNINPKAYENLALTRKALLDSNYDKAYNLVKNMQGLYSESYMPLGDLMLKQDLNTQKTLDYHRDLDISTGLATTTFTAGGVAYKREIFCFGSRRMHRHSAYSQPAKNAFFSNRHEK